MQTILQAMCVSVGPLEAPRPELELVDAFTDVRAYGDTHELTRLSSAASALFEALELGCAHFFKSHTLHTRSLIELDAFFLTGTNPYHDAIIPLHLRGLDVGLEALAARHRVLVLGVGHLELLGGGERRQWRLAADGLRGGLPRGAAQQLPRAEAALAHRAAGSVGLVRAPIACADLVHAVAIPVPIRLLQRPFALGLEEEKWPGGEQRAGIAEVGRNEPAVVTDARRMLHLQVLRNGGVGPLGLEQIWLEPSTAQVRVLHERSSFLSLERAYISFQVPRTACHLNLREVGPQARSASAT
mmetsp:Transcript_18773/g.55047  ORF Transcript_18773/g.55047 Transcript_18773/m.55047 type:complete len:300 (+) Transcript_18773:1332-2231(+)